MAELADAYGSGPYGGNPMEVQVLSPAPFEIERPASAGIFASWIDALQFALPKLAFSCCKRVQDEFEIPSCAERVNDVTYLLALLRCQFAGVAELADAYGSGPYGGNPMEVQVLSPAPFKIERPASAGLFAYGDNCSDLPFVPQTYLFWCETLCFILVDAALLSSGLSCLLL